MSNAAKKKSYYIKKPREEHLTRGLNPRKGFDPAGGVICKPCFDKQLEIDRLREENRNLKIKLKRVESIKKDGYFGNQTPSSKKPFKKTATDENRLKKGGAKSGHLGHGRETHDPHRVDQVIDVEKPQSCPECLT